ncbi:hypothetical protein AVEN_31811-1 [Araneus ventricosus]|uniref:Uncharacterized protein n=1 Tax=Araneus ventricosus TaxID=182803 RepID=A0A4Y2V2H2_ARAVE|nr:hypothetical protein AVEN_31811-1 [Araneus ventricosus]
MFRLQRLACRSANRRLLGAGGLFSVAGVTWCLNIAFDKHPKAAIKACLAGALSICLTKSVIFGDPSASLEETPKKRKTTARRVTDTSDVYSSAPLTVQLMKHIVYIGKELNEIAKDFDRRKLGTAK